MQCSVHGVCIYRDPGSVQRLYKYSRDSKSRPWFGLDFEHRFITHVLKSDICGLNLQGFWFNWFNFYKAWFPLYQ